jgi:hypothetical protein
MFGGASTAVLEKHKAALLFALLTGADTITEQLFKTHAVELLLGSGELREPGLSRESILLMVEDSAGLLPQQRIWELIRSMPLLEKRDGLYRARERIALADFQPGGEARLPKLARGVSWSLDELRNVFFPVVWPAWTVRDVRNAIQRGYGWFLWTLRSSLASGSGQEPLPAFWSCERGEDLPVGHLRAITSIGDTLTSLANSARFVCSLAGLQGDHRPKLGYGLRQLLDYRLEANLSLNPTEVPLPWGGGGFNPVDWSQANREWNRGGLLPFDDQPEAEYPTVDATWDAVLALAALYEQYPALAGADGLREAPRKTIGAALLDGVAFLVRLQLPAGGWGIYRYPADQPEVPAYEFTTGQTILALSLVLATSLFEDREQPALRAATEAALRRAWAFLRRRAVPFDGLSIWAPYFDDTLDAHSPRSLLRATIWTGTGLLALYRAFKDLREELAPRLQELILLAERHWQIDYRRSVEVEFRVPLRQSLHDVFGKWSNRYDLTVVILLLDLYNECSRDPQLSLAFSDGLWGRIERTLGLLIEEQHPQHGHWHEPIDGLPLAAATAMAIQALQSYLIAADHLATRPDVAPAQV